MPLIRNARLNQNNHYPLIIPSKHAWWPLHGNANSALTSLPNLTPASGATGNFTTQGFYTFPTANTTDIYNSGNSVNLDAVMTLIGAPIGTEIIVAQELQMNTPSGNGALWVYGQDNTTYGNIGVQCNSTRRLLFSWRGIGGSSNSYTWGSTAVFPSAGQHCAYVLSLRMITATTAIARLYRRSEVDSGWEDGGDSTTIDLRAGGATANPGRNGLSGHAGLSIGGRPTSGWTAGGATTIGNYALLYGNGSGTGRLGNLCVARFSSYDPNRIITIANDLWNSKREFPKSMVAS